MIGICIGTSDKERLKEYITASFALRDKKSLWASAPSHLASFPVSCSLTEYDIRAYFSMDSRVVVLSRSNFKPKGEMNII
jgi:hypothetical protein